MDSRKGRPLQPEEFGKVSTGRVMLVVIALIVMVVGICLLTYYDGFPQPGDAETAEHVDNPAAPPKPLDTQPGGVPTPGF